MWEVLVIKYIMKNTLICKKLIKGKDAVAIADEIEEPLERVSKICDIPSKYLPDNDVRKIMEELR